MVALPFRLHAVVVLNFQRNSGDVPVFISCKNKLCLTKVRLTAELSTTLTAKNSIALLPTQGLSQTVTSDRDGHGTQISQFTWV